MPCALLETNHSAPVTLHHSCSTSKRYRGRFAPSPNGPLHFGSLVCALASHLDARAHGGEWWLRIDDLDPPRTVPEATDALARELERLGLHWDRLVLQSARGEAHRSALRHLVTTGATFPCRCTRREVGTGPYPGTCRDGLGAGGGARSIRVRVDRSARLALADRIMGPIVINLERELGDFIVERADGIIGYQLASANDDAQLEMTHIVRGADLLVSSAAQHCLRDLLGYASSTQPRYAHLPLVRDSAGRKLGKSTGALPTASRPPGPLLLDALRFLGQPVGELEAGMAARELLHYAISHWRIDRVPRPTTFEP